MSINNYFLVETKVLHLFFGFLSTHSNQVTFFFGRHTAPYGSSQLVYRILITMHQKMRLKILRPMALSLGYLKRVVFPLITVFF